MSFALIFPGQGSQAVGMGRALAENFPAARTIFDEIDAALGENLSRLMWEGPAETLTLTQNAQPALLAVSMAVMAALTQDYGFDITRAACVAGHSLGEYSALAAAGAFSLSDAARLLRIRGQAMQAATPVGVGTMAAVLGLDFAAVAALAAQAAEDEVCAAANDNAPGQVVISGHVAAVERAMVLARAAGAKRAILLPVSAPFHCALMAPAARIMEEALAAVTVQRPRVPLIANVTAAPVQDPDEIRKLLVAQVTGTVRWRDCMTRMAGSGVDLFVEPGSGKVLTGLVKRNAPDARAVALSEPGDFAGALEEIGKE